MMYPGSIRTEPLVTCLQRDFCAQVPFPLPACVIDDAVTAFFRFLTEPHQVLSVIDFSIAPNHRRGDVGYKHRRAEDHRYNDDKVFFHFHPAIFQHYQEFVKAHPVVEDFLTKANRVWLAVYQTVHQLLNLLEPQFPGVVQRVFTTDRPHILLRFLRYDWQTCGEYLAKPHFDAGSATLAIAESCQGLRIGRDPQTLKLVHHQPGHGIFMLSSNYRQLVNSEEFSPGWHDVVQMDETMVGKSFARWALVAFIEAHGVQALSREVTHRWVSAQD